jgi:hypothetical protein
MHAISARVSAEVRAANWETVACCISGVGHAPTGGNTPEGRMYNISLYINLIFLPVYTTWEDRVFPLIKDVINMIHLDDERPNMMLVAS